MSMTNLVPSGCYINDVKNYATPQEWEQFLRTAPLGVTIKIPCMGDIYTFRMVGKGQDKLASGNTDINLVSFICEELYAGSAFKMNFTSINEGGWPKCAGREFIHSLLSTFPEALQAAIKTITKTSGVGNKETTIVSAYDKLWIPSIIELYGNPSAASWSVEGAQYNYYKNAGVTASNYASLIKKTLNGSAASYWLRSPSLLSTSSFGHVISSDGSFGGFSASGNNRACVGFCV